ncbi:MAG: DUF4136 domain-containing protein [Oxalobacteraceae bacterium]|nr:DUF4136 domain-containing protein [Oxalobacteraceae bacterium]
MKNTLRLALLSIAVLLAGCASTIRSDVTVFQEWPTELQDKSFVFEHDKSLESDLEYQSYQQLLRAELQRLGFTDAASPKAAALRVGFDYQVSVRDVREIQPVLVDPYWYGGGFYAPRFYRRGGFYDPFYDPFWYGPPIVAYQQSDYRLYHRQLHVDIKHARDGKKLYQVTVHSEGRNPSLAAVMPYMVRSAFVDFPAKSGVARQVKLPLKD